MASVASIRAIGQQATDGNKGRALLGEALRRLHDDGYERLDDVQSAGGTSDAAESLLDQARSYCERIYHELPDGAGVLTDNERGKVGLALEQTAVAIRQVEEAANLPGLMAHLESALFTVVGATTSAIASTAAGLVASSWPMLLVGAGVLWLVFAVRGRS